VSHLSIHNSVVASRFESDLAMTTAPKAVSDGVQVKKADGLHGAVGLYEMTTNGHAQYLTEQELQQYLASTSAGQPSIQDPALAQDGDGGTVTVGQSKGAQTGTCYVPTDSVGHAAPSQNPGQQGTSCLYFTGNGWTEVTKPDSVTNTSGTTLATQAGTTTPNISVEHNDTWDSNSVTVTGTDGTKTTWTSYSDSDQHYTVTQEFPDKSSISTTVEADGTQTVVQVGKDGASTSSTSRPDGSTTLTESSADGLKETTTVTDIAGNATVTQKVSQVNQDGSITTTTTVTAADGTQGAPTVTTGDTPNGTPGTPDSATGPGAGTGSSTGTSNTTGSTDTNGTQSTTGSTDTSSTQGTTGSGDTNGSDGTDPDKDPHDDDMPNPDDGGPGGPNSRTARSATWLQSGANPLNSLLDAGEEVTMPDPDGGGSGGPNSSAMVGQIAE
jgi:hypothetical protein